MKILEKLLYLLIALIVIVFTNEEINISVTALTGIINKKLDSTKTIFSFEINCEVNETVSNNLTQIDFIMEISQKDGINYNSICNLLPIKVVEEKTDITKMLCYIYLNESSNLNEETDLNIEDFPTNYISNNSDLPNLFFENFTDISEAINIIDLTLEYMEEDYCKDNNFFFWITSNNIPTRPLLSTICEVSLSNDESHNLAKCAIPTASNKIKCVVDVSETMYFENDNITILAQDLVPCDNGQKLNIANNANNILIIQEECGKTANKNVTNDNQGLFLNELFSLILLLLLL